jgi:hypothetical protein
VSAIGLKLSDLAAPNLNGGSHIVATYDYTDETGKPLFRKVRTEPKGFWQEHPDGAGGWRRGRGDARLVPFRLPELLQAKKECRPIWVCEGEKDVLVMEKAGFPANRGRESG